MLICKISLNAQIFIYLAKHMEDMEDMEDFIMEKISNAVASCRIKMIVSAISCGAIMYTEMHTRNSGT